MAIKVEKDFIKNVKSNYSLIPCFHGLLKIKHPCFRKKNILGLIKIKIMAKPLGPGVIVPIDVSDDNRILVVNKPTFTFSQATKTDPVVVKIEFSIPDGMIVQSADESDLNHPGSEQSHLKFDSGTTITALRATAKLEQLSADPSVNRNVSLNFDVIIGDGKVGGAGLSRISSSTARALLKILAAQAK